MKYIFADLDTIVEAFLTSIDEMPEGMERERLVSILEILLLYYSAANKDFTEEELNRKIRELDGKGAEIMTILEVREKRGIEEGIKEGIKEGKIDMAINLIKEGVDIELIVSASRLSRKEIEEIQKEIFS